MKTLPLIGIVIVLAIVAGLLLALSNIAKRQYAPAISSFDDCARAGHPIMESYPAQCRTPDGRTFVSSTYYVAEDEEPIVGEGCEVSGCSSQLCGEAGEEMMSTCEYRAEYACYKQHSSCERQGDGKCGWSPTTELAACISTNSDAEIAI